MSLTLRFLGTSASRPTVERNVSSIAVIREGETLMFDCGEGTQRQMMRYGITFALTDIFFTHMHADHMLGVIGLLRTLALQGRTEPMNLYGPVGCEKLLWRAINLGSEKQHFEIKVFELTPATPLKRHGYSIIPFTVEHGDRMAIGYHLAEETRLGRFNPEKAREMAIPEGPLCGKIHKGETVTLPDGRTIAPEELEGEVHQLLGRVRQRHAHDVGRSLHPVVMRRRFEQVELAFLLVPVGTYAFENGRAVVEGMRHQSELHVVVARELAIEEDPRVRMGSGFFHRGLGLGFHTH